MGKEIIKLNKGSLDQMILRNEAIVSHNQKIIRLRQQQLMKALQESTTLRIDIMGKVRNWIDLLEKRIFDPNVLDQMDMNKVMSLFRFVGTFTLKILAQLNDIESVMKSYTDSYTMLANLQTSQGSGKLTSEEVEVTKRDVMKAFVESVKKTVEDAEFSEKEKNITASPIENKPIETPGLEDTQEILDSKLEEDFPDIEKILS